MFIRMNKLWDSNIKRDLREIMGWESGRWLEQAQGCAQWRTFVFCGSFIFHFHICMQDFYFLIARMFQERLNNCITKSMWLVPPLGRNFNLFAKDSPSLQSIFIYKIDCPITWYLPLIENSMYMVYIIFICHTFMKLLIRKLYSLAVADRLIFSIRDCRLLCLSAPCSCKQKTVKEWWGR